jgi:hypothetical protein
MAQFILRNDFHHSEVILSLPRAGGQLSRGQVRKARQALCGLTGCVCGGQLGERGPQTYEVLATPDGGAIVRPFAREEEAR